MFWLPRVLWKVMEEGKLNSMLAGLNKAEKKGEKENDKKEVKKEDKKEVKKEDQCDNVAKNVIDYLYMKDAGHTTYGTGFLVSQVKHFISFSCLFLQ